MFLRLWKLHPFVNTFSKMHQKNTEDGQRLQLCVLLRYWMPTFRDYDRIFNWTAASTCEQGIKLATLLSHIKHFITLFK